MEQVKTSNTRSLGKSEEEHDSRPADMDHAPACSAEYHKGLSLCPGLLKKTDGLLDQVSLTSPLNLMAFSKLFSVHPLIVTFKF